MRNFIRSMTGAGLCAFLATTGVALSLTQSAHAASWHCENADTTGHATGATSAVLFSDTEVPLYTRYQYGRWEAYAADNWNWTTTTCATSSPYDSFSFYEVDSSSVSVNSPAAIMIGSTTDTVTAYTDSNGDLLVGYGTGPGGGMSTVWDNSTDYNVLALGTPTLANFNSTTYVFFSQDYYGANEVSYVTCNASPCPTGEGTWIDGGSGGYTTSATTPTAVAFNGKLWVFYWDEAHGCLMGQYSSDGSTFHQSSATGASGSCIDGWGGTPGGGQTSNNVGKFASAFVDTHANRLYVFYQDYTAGALRVSYMDASVGTWYAQVADSSVTMDSPPAAVLFSNNPEVYYIDSVNHRLKETWKSGSGWATPAIMDGASSSNCTDSSHTDSMAGPVAALVVGACEGGSSGPHIYYHDSTNGDLRAALWF